MEGRREVRIAHRWYTFVWSYCGLTPQPTAWPADFCDMPPPSPTAVILLADIDCEFYRSNHLTDARK